MHIKSNGIPRGLSTTSASLTSRRTRTTTTTHTFSPQHITQKLSSITLIKKKTKAFNFQFSTFILTGEDINMFFYSIPRLFFFWGGGSKMYI